MFSCSQLLLSPNALILGAGNGLNESSGQGSRAAKALAPLPPAAGSWAGGWSRTVLGTQQEKGPFSGSEAELRQGLAMTRKQNPVGLGLVSRAALASAKDLMFVGHLKLRETLPCSSCLPR